VRLKLIEIQDKYIDGLMPCLFFWTRTERGREAVRARVLVARLPRPSGARLGSTTGKPRRGRGVGVSRERRRRAASLLPLASLARCVRRNAVASSALADSRAAARGCFPSPSPGSNYVYVLESGVAL